MNEGTTRGGRNMAIRGVSCWEKVARIDENALSVLIWKQSLYDNLAIEDCAFREGTNNGIWSGIPKKRNISLDNRRPFAILYAGSS